MKGVILAGGTGSRLHPVTLVTNKHLLNVYSKPMIYYPIEKLIEAGIKDILIVSGPGHAGHFLNLLGSGRNLGARFTYEVQDSPLGIAQALSLAEDFADNQKFVTILGDNIFQDSIKSAVKEFEKGKDEARIFLKEVPDAHRFGVAEIRGDKIVGIEEKPAKPKSNLAVTGIYMYPHNVFDIIRTLKPSRRGEYEITDVNNAYIRRGKLRFSILKGSWTDAGTFESLYRASMIAREMERKGKK